MRVGARYELRSAGVPAGAVVGPTAPEARLESVRKVLPASALWLASVTTGICAV